MSFEEAIKIGKKLYERELIDGASGNLSFIKGNMIYITKSGESLDELKKDSFVGVSLNSDERELRNKKASSDSLIHIKTYSISDWKVILHCHGVYNVTLSMMMDSLTPYDLEGKLFLKEINFLKAEYMDEVGAEMIAEEMAERGFAVVRGHGIYTADSRFRDAFNKACYIEHSCKIAYLIQLNSNKTVKPE